MGGKASWRVKPGKSGWRFLLLPIGNGKTALTAVFRASDCRIAGGPLFGIWAAGKHPKLPNVLLALKKIGHLNKETVIPVISRSDVS